MNLYYFIEKESDEIEVDKLFRRLRHLNDEELESEEEKYLFDLICKICSMHEEYENLENVFQPMVIFEGRRSFSIEDLTDDDISNLIALELDRFPIAIRARLADVLWIKTNDDMYAKIAIESYNELFDLTYDSKHWVYCVDMITRALLLSTQLNDEPDLYILCCERIHSAVIQENGEDELFFSIRLIELLIKCNYIENVDLIEIINIIIENSFSNENKLRAAFDLKVKYFSKKGDGKKVKEVQLELAKSLETLADGIDGDENFQNISRKKQLLQDAAIIYKKSGDVNKSTNAHKKLLEIQKRLPESLDRIPLKFDISKEIQLLNKSFEELNFKECLIRLTQFTRFFTYEEIKESLKEKQINYVFINMCSNEILSNKGYTLATLHPITEEDIKSETKLFKQHMYRELAEKAGILSAIYLEYCLKIINEKFEISKEDLNFVINSNSIIPDERKSIIKTGICLGLKGDMYAALHILAPQIENLFRHIASEVGGITVKMRDDGISEEKSLKSIFEIRELKDCYDPDRLFIFKTLLNEKAGANIRNNIAHGIMEENEANNGLSKYFLCAVIKMLVLSSSEAMKVYTESELLKNNPFDKYAE